MEEPATWTLGGGATQRPTTGLTTTPTSSTSFLRAKARRRCCPVRRQRSRANSGLKCPKFRSKFGASVDTVTLVGRFDLVNNGGRCDFSSVLRLPVKNRSQRCGFVDLGGDRSRHHPHRIDRQHQYRAYIGANETTDVALWFNTSNVVDETPPDVLNLAVEVLEDGRVIVSWYTSERQQNRCSSTVNRFRRRLCDQEKSSNHHRRAQRWHLRPEVLSADASAIPIRARSLTRRLAQWWSTNPPQQTTMRMRSPFRRFRANDSTRRPCCCGAGAGVPSGSPPRCR